MCCRAAGLVLALAPVSSAVAENNPAASREHLVVQLQGRRVLAASGTSAKVFFGNSFTVVFYGVQIFAAKWRNSLQRRANANRWIN